DFALQLTLPRVNDITPLLQSVMQGLIGHARRQIVRRDGVGPELRRKHWLQAQRAESLTDERGGFCIALDATGNTFLQPLIEGLRCPVPLPRARSPSPRERRGSGCPPPPRFL